ncbi:MAG: class I SAM-dependent methyltransferase [Planctomycetota bacterium]
MREQVYAEYRQRAEEHWWFRARRHIFGKLLDAHVPLPQGARILDLGPGSGVNLPILRDRGAVTTVDLSRDSLDDCRAQGARHLLEADASAPPLVDGSFDLVCALDVLEHLPDDAAALRAWRELLAPGARLLLSVPALSVLWGRQDVLSGHFRRYRRAALNSLLRDAGLRVERLSYFNSVLFPPILAVRLLMRPFLGRTAKGNGSDLSMTSPALDGALYRVFAAEAGWLRRRNLPLGVSLVGLARRDEGGA